ncbi:MAG: hypothetical protein U5K84_02530 [Alkalibacterium sp.]|nr:hypothetical protein [Alkalibacterium sp.]
MHKSNVSEELILPNGVRVKNRFLKSAMSETLANRHHQPTDQHEKLYSIWAEGGSGIVVTGNVMIDPKCTGGAGKCGRRRRAGSKGAETMGQGGHPE